MLKENDFNLIKEVIEEFFRKMTYDPEIEVLAQKEKTIPINLKIDEPQILIGERGQTLSEIQHLLKLILRRKINPPGSRSGQEEESFYIDLDINDYKKKKIEYLKEVARSLADEVVLTKKEKQLPLMSAYERRIIHLELADRQDVTTESIGQEPERRLVIRPHP